MRDAVMAGNTVHRFQFIFVYRGRIETRLNIHILIYAAVIVGHADVWNVLIKFVSREILYVVFDMPVDTTPQANTFRAATRLENQVDAVRCIF